MTIVIEELKKQIDGLDLEKQVINPSHYKQHPKGIECIDVCEEFSANLSNVIKYVWRAGLKEKNPLVDLKKAEWYLRREMDRLAKKSLECDDPMCGRDYVCKGQKN